MKHKYEEWVLIEMTDTMKVSKRCDKSRSKDAKAETLERKNKRANKRRFCYQ